MLTQYDVESFTKWTRFDETFDEANGGCLYLRVDPEDPYGKVQAAGVLWLDSGPDESTSYWAGIASFDVDEDRYGDTNVVEIYDAADAFSECLDSEIEDEIGWFETMPFAMEAVEKYVEND